MSIVLCSCAQTPAAKSSFGQIDAMEDGVVLVSDVDAGEEDVAEEDVTSDATIKTSVNLDVNDLPESMEKMVGLCDAINMACVENRKIYNADDNELVWHSVHLYVSGCSDTDMGFKQVGDYIEADPKIVDAAIYSMFGKLRTIPEIPEDILYDPYSGRDVHIQISNNLKYRFAAGDRGMSAPEVRRATQYSEGSAELEVALVDEETKEETVSFIYTLRANTRDTTTAAIFDYEITGVRAADKITSDKMSGIPFLTSVIQTYDGKDVVEILYFNSFQEHVPGLEEIDAAISHEMLEYANAPIGEDSWHEIISYPVSTDNYVQYAVTYAIRPDEVNDPDIRCYNYDKKKSRVMDINDCYNLLDTTADKLSKKVVGLYTAGHDDETVAGLGCRGFIVKKDRSLYVYYVLDTRGDDGAVSKRLVAFDSASTSLIYYNEGQDLIPEDETDTMKPPLTHGRGGR